MTLRYGPRLLPVVSSTLLMMLAGCESPPGWMQWGMRPMAHESPGAGWGDAGRRKSTINERSSDRPTLVRLSFQVVRIEFPGETVRHAEKIWNHVDQLRIDPGLVAHLARNGLRVGVGSSGAWPAIKTIIEAGDADVRREDLHPPDGIALAILLSPIRTSEAIFTYDSNNRLNGKTFMAGDKLVVIESAFHPDTGGRTEIQLGFEIRRDLEAMKWVTESGVVRQVPDYDRYVFPHLEVFLTVDLGEFLVIGPSGGDQSAYIMGSRFFSSGQSGDRRELLLCISPKATYIPL